MDATGLTPEDKSLIRDTWAKVYDESSRKPNGISFFMMLFKDHPYMLEYFAQFKGKSLPEVEKSEHLVKQASVVFNAVNKMVGSLDAVDSLVKQIKTLAETHFKRGIKAQQFQDLKGVFLQFAKQACGSAYHDGIGKAWDTFLNTLISIVKSEQDRM